MKIKLLNWKKKKNKRQKAHSNFLLNFQKGITMNGYI